MTVLIRALCFWILCLLPNPSLGQDTSSDLGQGDSLRIYIRAGEKTHGPGQHDHPRFLAEWSELLRSRGAQVSGSLNFPSDAELAETDVLVMYAANAASISGMDREIFEAFQARGGGLVVLHDGVCGDDPGWFKTRAGGAWEDGQAKWLEGEIGLYMDHPHPITRGIPHFDLVDEIYYDMHMAPNAQVLANSFHDVFSVAPQMWVVDEPGQRVFVSLQGHEYKSFSHPALRTLLLRGIAWAGRREVNLLTDANELAQLRYPPGGPLAPDAAGNSFELNEEFEINLVAAEPLVVNPISIDWDHRGRLWVAQTPGYPYKTEFSGIAAHDEICILTDLDADGRMDESKTFAGGLDLVTSFVFHGDGVIVTQAPDILWLRDRDGDDVADERVVLFTGFGYADTHAVTSNLRWGLDGWIYGTQGYSGGNSRDVRSPYFDAHSGEPSRAFGHIPGGVFRFKADGSAMQPYSIYGSNTWGLDFSPAGDLFFTMANGSHLRQALLSEQELGANRIEGTKTWQDIVDHRQVQRLSKATRAPYVQIDYVGGFTAASGCTIYSGGVWPEEFAGNHFVCEPTVNLVHRDVLSVDGATHRASKPRQAEFLASTDPWFRPVQTRVGPAGDLFVVDFYNQAAVHNDTRGPSHGPTNAAVRPDRDAMHGRIWRVQHREALTEPALGAHFWNGMRDLRGLREGVLPESAAPSLFDSSKEVRVRALWFAFHSERLEVSTLQAGLIDTEPMVRRAAARIAGEVSGESGYESLGTSLASLVHDSDPGVQLAALATLVHFNLGDAQVTGLIADYDQLQNDWVRSAFLRLAEQHSTRFLEAFFKRANSSSDIESVDLLLRLVAIRAQAGSPAEVLRLLELLQGASKPLTRFLPRIVETLQTDLAPQFTFGSANERAGVVLASLFEAYQENSQASRALLPLAARIQNSPPLERSIAGAAKELLSAAMSEQEDLQVRQDALLTLLEIPAWRASAIEASEAFLGPHYAPGPQQQLIKALGKTRNEGAAKQLARAFPRVTNASRDAIFKELIARPEWTGFLLDEIVDEEIRVGDLGPRRLFRLREHSDKATAKRAKFVLDQYSAPAPAMEELIESLLPVILQAGDLQKGRELFIQNCAVCHRYDGLPEGLGADVGPSLVGMGAHGAEHLLPFILDPNLSVEAAFLEYVAETTDGQMLTGVLTYDGPDSITLASSAGTESIRRSSLVDLYSTGRSPMPTGFESLGAEALRDLLAFLCEGYGDYRIVNLESQFNSSTSLGLYDQRYDVHSMRFHSFGVVQVAGTPMEIFDPGLMPEGNNAVVLKGGARDDWQSKMDMPQRIEVPIGFALQRMHVLGGISAWGHPFFGDEDPAVSWTFHYADGSSEEHVLRDGVEFADWIRRHDVPGSEYVEGLLHDNSVGQLRSFSVDPGKPELVIDSLTLESFDNRTAPTFLALTAQLLGAGPKIAAPAVILTYPRLMILGGGSSHDFPRWFDQELRSTLAQGTHFEVSEIEYTSRPMDLLPRLPELEVLVLSNNKAMDHAGLRQGIFDHVAAGGGLLLVHAALWYNWADWPEYNQKLVGGGSRSHEAYGTFDVQLVKEHPVLEGLPTEFTVEDELYRFEADSSGTAIEVLARGTSKVTGNSYPVVWITQTPAGRVLCVSLGHDGAVHEHPAFQRLIQNAAGWLDPETD